MLSPEFSIKTPKFIVAVQYCNIPGGLMILGRVRNFILGQTWPDLFLIKRAVGCGHLAPPACLPAETRIAQVSVVWPAISQTHARGPIPVGLELLHLATAARY